jgi:molybdate transport system substrate-binding protein
MRIDRHDLGDRIAHQWGGGSLKRTVTLVVCVVFALVAILGVGYAVRRLLDRGNSGLSTKTLGGSGGESNAISIYAPNQLSKVLEQVTTAFQQENPGTTFQFTLGPSDELAKRVRDGQKPNLYIDVGSAIDPVSAKARGTVAPVAFGYDIVQLATMRGNPKQVELAAFGNSALNTGICGPELFCGKLDTLVLDGVGVKTTPKVVTNNVGELTDGLKNGQIDAVLLLRTDLRSALANITTPPMPSTFRIDYKMLQLRNGGPANQFIQWVQGSPNARHALRFAGMLSFYDV